MPAEKNTQYSYLFFLAISFLLIAGAWNMGFLPIKEIETNPSSSKESTSITESTETTEIMDNAVSNELQSSETVSPNSIGKPAEKKQEPKLTILPVADRSYFDDALFIGDSRTVGLYEYGDLSQALVLADSGMNIYKVFKRTFTLSDGTQRTLEEILTQNQFGKIYLMLGINELGYNFEQTVSLYEDVVKQIESYQPEAILYLQANLHITDEKSNKSDIFNNDNINRFNNEIRKLTELSDSDNRLFLDVNELFDDENGNLSKEYTVDEAHVLGKYYINWVDWLLQHAFIRNLES